MDAGGREDERTSAVDQVVAAIRDLIRDRGLNVGDALPGEIEIAAMAGASRNTVREAIRILKAYGLVESRPKIGAVITDRRQTAVNALLSFAIDLSAESFRDIQGFRRLIEMNLGEVLVGRIAPAEIAELRRLNAAMAAAADPFEAARLDFLFHRSLVDAAGNRTLAEIYAMLEPVIRRLMETGKSLRRAREGAAAEHDDIVGALERGDRLGFAYHMSRHLDAGLEYIPAARTDGPPERGGR